MGWLVGFFTSDRHVFSGHLEGNKRIKKEKSGAGGEGHCDEFLTNAVNGAV